MTGSALGGAVASALLIYYFFDFLGLGDLFERRHGARVRRLEAQMARRGGFWLVAGWSVFPLTPTDVICYVAGTLRMPVARFAAAVALGKTPLVAFYVWATGTVVERLFVAGRRSESVDLARPACSRACVRRRNALSMGGRPYGGGLDVEVRFRLLTAGPRAERWARLTPPAVRRGQAARIGID